jgi:hypothetical protein
MHSDIERDTAATGNECEASRMGCCDVASHRRSRALSACNGDASSDPPFGCNWIGVGPIASHMQANDRSHIALYVWDYFFISNCPAKGDERPWSAIERATQRIRESEVHLDPRAPADVRVRHARRVRSAARTAMRNIERLSIQPEQWVVDRLVELEAFSQKLLQELSADARDLAVH